MIPRRPCVSVTSNHVNTVHNRLNPLVEVTEISLWQHDDVIGLAGDAIDANDMCQYCCGDDVSCGISERELGKLNQEAAHLLFICFVLTSLRMVLFWSWAFTERVQIVWTVLADVGCKRSCSRFNFQIVFKWLLWYHLFRRLDSQLGT